MNSFYSCCFRKLSAKIFVSFQIKVRMKKMMYLIPLYWMHLECTSAYLSNLSPLKPLLHTCCAVVMAEYWFPKICFISVTLHKFPPWNIFSPVPFFFGSILKWGDIKKDTITNQSKEYGSSTWMITQLGWCREEVTFVVKISGMLMPRVEVSEWGRN